MYLIFFDTETTGTEKKDRLCQFAYVSFSVDGETLKDHQKFEDFYKPPLKIGFEAMSVHHITNEMIENRPAFTEAKEYKEIKSMFESKDNIVVAHNANFDIGMLAREGIEVAKSICTLKIARYLDPEGKLPNYKLQYLRYLLGLTVIDADAHDAMGDVNVLQALFERLYKKVGEQNDIPFPMPEDHYNEMVRISEKPSIIVKFVFGKHIGEKIADVAISDKNYLEWLLKSEQQKETPDENMVHTLKQYV